MFNEGPTKTKQVFLNLLKIHNSFDLEWLNQEFLFIILLILRTKDSFQVFWDYRKQVDLRVYSNKRFSLKMLHSSMNDKYQIFRNL